MHLGRGGPTRCGLNAAESWWNGFQSFESVYQLNRVPFEPSRSPKARDILSSRRCEGVGAMTRPGPHQGRALGPRAGVWREALTRLKRGRSVWRLRDEVAALVPRDPLGLAHAARLREGALTTGDRRCSIVRVREVGAGRARLGRGG